MLIPLSTDAPIYHFPKATLVLILINTICFVITGRGEPELLNGWVLEYDSINPLQWVTSIFVHAGYVHLIGNMFFLWAFGLIVEGKLGFRGMLQIYLGVGVGQSALEQLIMLGSQGGSLGASAAIMGLMAICFVWAPKNEFSTFVILFFHFIFFEITIYWYCILCLVEQVIGLFLYDRGQIGSSALHLMGAFVGFGLGSLYLKKGWVDCEKWDLFRVIAGTYGPYAESETHVGSHADPTLMFGTKDVAVKDSEPHSSQQSQRSQKKTLKKLVDDLVDSGDYIQAAEKMFDLRMKDSNAALDSSRVKKLALGLIQANMPDEAELYLEESIERFPEECAWARVHHAQICLVVNKRPRAAIDQLTGIRLSQLPESLAMLAKKIAATAKKQIREGVQDAELEW